MTTFLHVDEQNVDLGKENSLPDHTLIRVEGSVLLTVNAIVLLSDEIVDSVFMIWEFLMEGLVRVGSGETYKISYPDLDYPIEIKEVESRVNTRHVRLTVGRTNAYARAVVPWDELYHALSDGAEEFVTHMERLAPRFVADYAGMREQIGAVRAYGGESNARLYGAKSQRPPG